jgi:uncharacterized protein (DUF1330 family)
MSKAKLLGLDKQIIEHGNQTQNIVVTFEEANKVRDLTETELCAVIAATTH